MARRQLRTGDYPEAMRTRLGRAVEHARIAAGYPTRPAFLAAFPQIKSRSLVYLEQGDRSVGIKVLQAVSAVLPGWTADTPQTILEGGPIPELDGRAEKISARDEYVRRLKAAEQLDPDVHPLVQRLLDELDDEAFERLITDEDS